MKLYGFPIRKDENIFEIGCGEGHLSKKLLQYSFKVIGALEPDQIKMQKAKENLKGCYFFETTLIDVEFLKKVAEYAEVTLVLQDVIEHIPIAEFQYSISYLKKMGCSIRILGRTPNLTSPFGLRNSFGDLTHIHRFTNRSLKQYLEMAGFKKINVKDEPYTITGITSFLRFFLYHSVTLVTSLAFLFIYGSWEGKMAPNLVFEAVAVD